MNNKEHNNLPKQEENLNNECDMPNQKYLIVNKLFKTYIGGYTGINDISFDLQKGEQLIISITFLLVCNCKLLSI